MFLGLQLGVSLAILLSLNWYRYISSLRGKPMGAIKGLLISTLTRQVKDAMRGQIMNTVTGFPLRLENLEK